LKYLDQKKKHEYNLPGIQWTSIGLQNDGNGVNSRVEGVCTKGSSLDGLRSGGNGGNTGSKAIVPIRPDNSVEGELELSNVTDSNSVGATGSSNHSVEGTEGTILNVNTHFVRSVVGSLPKLNIGIKGTSLGLQQNLHRFNGRVGKRPGTKRSSLHNNRGGVVPDLSKITSSHTSGKRSSSSNIDIVTD
jgi:hypothetical protein